METMSLSQLPAPGRSRRSVSWRPRFPVQQDRRSRAPGRLFDSVVIGLGYAGLPTAVSLAFAGQQVHGVDLDQARLTQILRDRTGLGGMLRTQLRKGLATGRLTVSNDASAIGRAWTIVVCPPTPEAQDLKPLRDTCAAVVHSARRGQVVVLTSTPYVGAAEDLLVAPLLRRGLVVGEDIHVCFSPEPGDPGSLTHAPELTPRIIGGATLSCLEAGVEAIGATCAGAVRMPTLEAAELRR
jgi:UDP-N-acetyl-D-glucosamine dehydrogenase